MFKIGDKVRAKKGTHQENSLGSGTLTVDKSYRAAGYGEYLKFKECPPDLSYPALAFELVSKGVFAIGTIVGILPLDIAAPIKSSFENEDVTYYELEGLGGAWQAKHLEVIDFGVFESYEGVYEVVVDGKVVAWSKDEAITACPAQDLRACISCLEDKPSITCYGSFRLTKRSYANYQAKQADLNKKLNGLKDYLNDIKFLVSEAELRNLTQKDLDKASELALSIYVRLTAVSIVKGQQK